MVSKVDISSEGGQIAVTQKTKTLASPRQDFKTVLHGIVNHGKKKANSSSAAQQTLKDSFIKALDISLAQDDGKDRNIFPAIGNLLPAAGSEGDTSKTASTSLYNAMSAYAYHDSMSASSNVTNRRDFEQSYKNLNETTSVGTPELNNNTDNLDEANTIAPNPRVDRYDDIVQSAANKYGIDSALIKAVIRAESGGNAKAVSSAGARGLMQLMPATARELGVKNSFDPKDNIEGGTKYLRQLLDRYNGNVNQAIAAYNWGMGNLERRPSKMPAETKNYITKVQSYYKNYSGNFDNTEIA